MNVIALKIDQVTYKELKEGLLHLNYMDRSTKDSFRFEHAATKSVIIIRAGKDDEIVNPANFTSLTLDLHWHGLIKDREDLGDWIVKNCRQNQPQSFV